MLRQLLHKKTVLSWLSPFHSPHFPQAVFYEVLPERWAVQEQRFSLSWDFSLKLKASPQFLFTDLGVFMLLLYTPVFCPSSLTERVNTSAWFTGQTTQLAEDQIDQIRVYTIARKKAVEKPTVLTQKGKLAGRGYVPYWAALNALNTWHFTTWHYLFGPGKCNKLVLSAIVLSAMMLSENKLLLSECNALLWYKHFLGV